jgi:alkaline phosphatase D
VASCIYLQRGGYTAVELTPELWRSDFYQVDNMENPDSAVTNIASFVTEAGNPGVQEA